MKKVVIIGGGVSGLSAGIYAQQMGYETEIYEKNPMVGGECTGWNRQGYHIDNCIHWLTGCQKQDDLYSIWNNVGVLDDDVKLYREDYIYMLEMDGVKLHFWRDIEKARKEFLRVAPEDSAEINKFFDNVKLAECVRVPFEKAQTDMNFIEFMKFVMPMKNMSKVMKEYGQESVKDFAQRFKNPYVKAIIGKYFSESFLAYTLVTSYAFLTSSTAAIPMGGSVGLVNRMIKRYNDLGGKIFTNKAAEKVNIVNGKAKSVSFADGGEVPCDYVICATDTSVTFSKFLPEEYMPKNLKTLYKETKGYRVSSGFNVSFGVEGSEPCSPKGATIFPCENFKVGKQTCDFMGTRMYDYDESLFPSDKRVIQCNFLQDEEDYAYWKNLYADRERYNAEKKRIAVDVEKRIINQFPELEGRLKLLCTYSPYTFTKWCGAYKGAYMSFYEQKGYKALTMKHKVKGLSNVILAGQWTAMNGGLPVAVTSGKFAAQKLPKIKSK